MHDIVPMMPSTPKEEKDIWSHLLRCIAEKMKEPLFPIDVENLLGWQGPDISQFMAQSSSYAV
jgi:hypothetical protein